MFQYEVSKFIYLWVLSKVILSTELLCFYDTSIRVSLQVVSASFSVQLSTKYGSADCIRLKNAAISLLQSTFLSRFGIFSFDQEPHSIVNFKQRYAGTRSAITLAADRAPTQYTKYEFLNPASLEKLTLLSKYLPFSLSDCTVPIDSARVASFDFCNCHNILSFGQNSTSIRFIKGRKPLTPIGLLSFTI
jgi:hypothetical protein